MNRIDLRRPELGRADPTHLREEQVVSSASAQRQQDRFDFSQWPQRRPFEVILGEGADLLEKDADIAQLARRAAGFLITKV